MTVKSISSPTIDNHFEESRRYANHLDRIVLTFIGALQIPIYPLMKIAKTSVDYICSDKPNPDWDKKYFSLIKGCFESALKRDWKYYWEAYREYQNSF